MVKNKLGQYFTTNETLQKTVYKFIFCNPKIILEPSVGRGDLVNYIMNVNPDITFEMYEIDNTIKVLPSIDKQKVKYTDFLKEEINNKFKTIIGNPPYIKNKKGNVYIDFIEKCYNLLESNGELIFIVPSDFFKLTGTCKLLQLMLNNGSFTHIFHPHSETLFANATIDILVFRYCKGIMCNKVMCNENLVYLNNSNGLITFSKTISNTKATFQDYFEVYVGLVSAKESVYKNEELGNIQVINGKSNTNKYIYIQSFPSEDEKINKYLLDNKEILINRGIRKFTEKNWFEWGAPRNIKIMEKHINEPCIYLINLTRNTEVSFVGTVNYFGGNLIMLRLKPKLNSPEFLYNVVNYLNSQSFRDTFTFSGRFKIGHRQISNTLLPDNLFEHS